MNMKGGFVGSGQGIMRRLTCIQSHDKSLHLSSVTAFSFVRLRHFDMLRERDKYPARRIYRTDMSDAFAITMRL